MKTLKQFRKEVMDNYKKRIQEINDNPYIPEEPHLLGSGRCKVHMRMDAQKDCSDQLFLISQKEFYEGS